MVLSFLFDFFTEVRLPGDRVSRLAKHLVSRGVPMCFQLPLKKAEGQIYLYA